MRILANALLSLLALLIATPAALPSSEQWNLNPQFYYGSIGGTPSDLSMFMGVRPDATDDCYDWFDYIKPDPPPGDYVYAYWDRPECGGKKAGDWRTALAPGECKEWDRLVCYANNAGDIWMTWPVYGGSAWDPPPEYTFMLYDVTLGAGPIDMEWVSDYHWTQATGGPAGAHEFRIVVAANDTTPPAITCPGDIAVYIEPGTCHASVSVGEAACDDECTCTVYPVRSDGLSLADPYPVGVTTITWTATDGAGNTASCQQMVTVIDNVVPVISQCADDRVLPADTNCEAVLPDLTGEVVASDNCDTTLDVAQSPSAGTLLGSGDTTVMLTVSDDDGNVVSCTATVSVVDTTAPTVVACASDKSLAADDNGEAPIPDLTGEVVASDNCDSSLDVTQSPPAGTMVGLGDTIVTLTIADDAGNSTTCTATVTVVHQWNLNPQFYYGSIGGTPSDLSMFMGVRPDATDDCYDWFDYIKPDPPPGDYVYAYWDRPECGGKKAGDWRAGLAPDECKVWDRLVCYSNTAGTITMIWPVYGGPSWEPPAAYRFHLYDVTLGIGPIDMESTAEYSWSQSGGGPSEPHELVICVCAGTPPMPTACFTQDQQQVGAGEAVCFDASCSSGDIVSYQWDFGDGATESGPTPCHSYLVCGQYDVCLTVSGLCGGTDSVCHTVYVGEWLTFPIQGGCWHMITVPCNPFDPDPAQVFRDDLGNPITIVGNLHRYDPAIGNYRTYGYDPLFGDIVPGDGYWLWAFDDANVQYFACCPDGEVLVEYPAAGWHLTGHPKLTTSMDVESLTFRHGGSDYTYAAAAYYLISNPMFTYRCWLQGYENVGFEPWDTSHTVEGFRGYWLCTFQDDVRLVAP